MGNRLETDSLEAVGVNQISEEALACAQSLTLGFQSGCALEIEKGLCLSQRLFRQFVMEDQFEALRLLGRELSRVYIRYSNQKIEISSEFALGQLRSVINLCLYFRQIKEIEERKE